VLDALWTLFLGLAGLVVESTFGALKGCTLSCELAGVAEGTGLDLVIAGIPELAKLLVMVHGRLLMTEDTLPVVLQLLMTDSSGLIFGGGDAVTVESKISWTARSSPAVSDTGSKTQKLFYEKSSCSRTVHACLWKKDTVPNNSCQTISSAKDNYFTHSLSRGHSMSTSVHD
jgi:hypothetical protein